MKILFISNVPIKRENSIGNSFLNIFEGVEDVTLSNIYTREGIPDIEVLSGFCITEPMQINSFLNNTSVGKWVTPSDQYEKNNYSRKEKAVIGYMKGHRWTVFFWLQDLLWKAGRWKTPQLEDFVKRYSPDIVFTVLSNSVYINDLILHICALSNAKLVLYAWDNNYSLRRFAVSPLRWIKHFIDRASMRELAEKADLFYVISQVQKEDYEKCFHKECKLLTKGADFFELPDMKQQYNTPLQLVFTGNIGLNRWKSLKLIADVLENINKDGIKAQLRIYTGTPLTKKMGKALNRGESSYIMGSVPASEVADIQHNADILVHVEAFDLKNRLTVRQSFSTKIVDYLKAARPILAVGPKDVASIDHLVRNECAIVADSKAELEQKLREVIADTNMLSQAVVRAYECGRKYHNKRDIQKMLMEDLTQICGK